MPYGIRKLPNKNLYRVYNRETDEIYAKATKRGNAEKQIRLLNMIESKKSQKK